MSTSIENILLSPVICLKNVKKETLKCDEAKNCLKEQLKDRLKQQLDLFVVKNSQIEEDIIKKILQPELDWTIRSPIWPRI